MNDGFGNPIYIYNPFTYEQLHQLAGPSGNIDRYLRCISKLQEPQQQDGGAGSVEACEKPIVPEIDGQGVSVIAVIERCRANYQQMQWDVGAFMLYDQENSAKALQRTSFDFSSPQEDDLTGACLLQAQRNKESNLDCMMKYLSSHYPTQSNEAVFWRYEKADKAASDAWPSDEIDACIVFSGTLFLIACCCFIAYVVTILLPLPL
jgi:hypothetical protein